MKVAQRFQRWVSCTDWKLVPEGRLKLVLNLDCSPATPTPAVRYGPKMGILAHTQPIATALGFPQCGKPSPNPASSPSLLGIQPVVFPS